MLRYFVVFSLIFYSAAYGCPFREDVTPCVCKINGSMSLHCPGINTEQDLVRIARLVRRRTDLYSIEIADSAINYIPQDTFTDIFVKGIVISRSSFYSLSDTDIAFDGLQQYINFLYIINSTMLGNWEWAQLRKLNHLTSLKINGANLESIEENIKDIAHLDLLGLHLAKNRISFIHATAFSDFHRLHLLDLSYNQISDIKRDMFPNPANRLYEINLSFNQIQELPDNMFTDMPNLKRVLLKSNLILTLKEEVFSNIWDKLERFDSSLNDLRCDCRLSWMLNKPQPRVLIGTCAEPPGLFGESLKMLGAKDLRC
ncbi:slit homolog 1 protein-like [Uloborus diversus]|uniref:slit homolog 1 protein-like n=1 Tax=Uloborus diversus TaxID=327109 RepID=UPI002409C830|nr:slit homolog 1 protein-like [Uloborus diversus]